MLIIDGYNIINQWPQLKAMLRGNLSLARDSLINIIQQFCDFSGQEAVVVFDGRAKEGDFYPYQDTTGRLKVVFSRKGETADTVIERLVYNRDKKNTVLVASADRALRNIIFGLGAFDISAEGLRELVCSYVESPRLKP